MVSVNWRWMVKFQASTVAAAFLTITNGVTPFGRIGKPLGPFGCEASTWRGPTTSDPCPSVNTVSKFWPAPSLNAENGEVLRDVVAEDGAENAEVVTAAITHADHGLCVELVSNTERAGRSSVEPA